MEGGRTAVCSSLGDEKEGPWRGTSIYADEHGEPHVYELEAGMLEGGRAAGCSSLGDDKEGPQGGTSTHTGEHGELGIDILKS